MDKIIVFAWVLVGISFVEILITSLWFQKHKKGK